MRGRIISYFDGAWVIRPDGSRGCDVVCHESDLAPDAKGLEVEFELEPTACGFRAVNVRASDEES